MGLPPKSSQSVFPASQSFAAAGLPDLKSLSDLAVALMAYPSISRDFLVCRQACEFVATLFAESSYTISWYESAGRTSLIISRQREHAYSVAFVGHLDVVPGPESIFIPRIEGDRLYGRGSADMKGSCAVMIQLFLDHELTGLLDDCALVLTTDEETGGEHGAHFLIQEIGLKAAVVVVPDGGDALVPCIFEKGIQHARLEAFGKRAHGARPWLGKSATEALLRDLIVLKDRFQKVHVDNQWDVSLNVGRIGGGEAANSVADYAWAELDFRLPTGLSVAELRQQIQDSVSRTTVTFLGFGEAVVVNESCPVYQLFCEALVEFGGSSVGVAEHGTCDARWFVPQESVILITKPLCSAFHIDDEWVDVPSLGRLYGAFEMFCKKLRWDKRLVA